MITSLDHDIITLDHDIITWSWYHHTWSWYHHTWSWYHHTWSWSYSIISANSILKWNAHKSKSVCRVAQYVVWPSMSCGPVCRVAQCVVWPSVSCGPVCCVAQEYTKTTWVYTVIVKFYYHDSYSSNIVIVNTIPTVKVLVTWSWVSSHVNREFIACICWACRTTNKSFSFLIFVVW